MSLTLAAYLPIGGRSRLRAVLADDGLVEVAVRANDNEAVIRMPLVAFDDWLHDATVRMVRRG